MVKKENEKDAYIQALEDELSASIERERKLAEEDLSFGGFLVSKMKKTKIYRKTIAEPGSRMGKVARAPRSFYRIIKNPEVRKSLIQKKTVNDVAAGRVEEGHFLDPWMVGLAQRRKVAEKALVDGKKLALYFVEKPDSSTFRYRCYNTFEATKASKKWQAVYFFKDETEAIERLVPKSKVLIFGRQSGQEKNVAKLTKLAHKNKVRVGLDIDDLVFDVKYLDMVLDIIGEKNNSSYWAAYFASVQAMAEKVDFFITTNKFLSGKLCESFERPCREIRNSLNQAQVSASLVYEKWKNKKGFVIGYFSGSPTHKNDLEVALPGVLSFLSNHANAKLKVVGFMRFEKEAQKYLDNGQIEFVPPVDFRKLQRLMAEVDVNIAPLVINDFTNCKSELKFFEAAAVETTTIASPTYTFKKAITDGENGFLAQPGEWYDKLEYLYEHPEENRKVALAAKEYALKHYYGKEFLRQVEDAYGFFTK